MGDFGFPDGGLCWYLLLCCLFGCYVLRWRRGPSYATKDGFVGLIGDTPMVELKTLSKLTGCTILGKAEFLNPGGSLKDRVARQIVFEAERDGTLSPGGTIYEGTAGSTGIALAQVTSRPTTRTCNAVPRPQ